MEPDLDGRSGEPAHDVGNSAATAVGLSQNSDRSGRIRVLLADDHQILREGLASLLADEPDMEVVGEAGDGQEAIELARSTAPDVILMDVTMPGVDGIQATRQITSEISNVRVIGLSMHEEEDMAKAMRAAGASAYLSKGGPSEALIAAIRGHT